MTPADLLSHESGLTSLGQLGRALDEESMGTVDKAEGDATSPKADYATNAAYSYQSLDSETSIRILELLPGSKEDPIQCRLSIHKRESAPMYEALSYAWGDLKDKREVICHGKIVKVPKSLAEFLRRLRHASNVRRLWADAICIDQSNTNEVGHQVRQMGPIYAEAERVLIWLGPEDHFKTFDQDMHASTLLRIFVDGLDKTQRPLDYSWFDRNQFAIALKELLDHEWFERLWIVQEAGLAKSRLALFGDRQIDLDDLLVFLHDINVMDPYGDDTYDIPTWIESGRIFYLFPTGATNPHRWWAAKLDFLDVLQLTRMSLASDPRDYVFAMLGHPSAKINGVPVAYPDYNKTSWQVFHDLAIELLKHDNLLRVLAAIRHDTQENLERDFPSWVPVWDRKPYGGVAGVESETIDEQDASAGFQSSLRLVNENRILQTNGFLFDTVHECTDQMIYETSQANPDLSLINNWPIERALTFEALLNIPFETRLHDLYLSLIGITLDDVSDSLFYEKFTSFCLTVLRERTAHGNNDSHKSVVEGLKAASKLYKRENALIFARWCEFWVAGKRLFATRGGLLGIGPTVLHPGDVCCILYGSTIPFVLRPIGSRYRLVGSIFVPKVMQGEAMVDFMLGEKYQEQVFDIF